MCHEIEGIDILLTGHQHGNCSHRNKRCNSITNRMQWTLRWKSNNNIRKNRTKLDKKRAIHNYCPCKELLRTKIFFLWLLIMKRNTELARSTYWANLWGHANFRCYANSFARPSFIEFINKIQMDIANVSISCTSLFHNTSRFSDICNNA